MSRASCVQGTDSIPSCRVSGGRHRPPAAAVSTTGALPLNRRGSTLAAALALVFLIFMIVSVSLTRIAASHAQMNMRHRQTSAQFIAEAGVQKAAHRLMADSAYSGERGTRLGDGGFDVSVSRLGGGFTITSTGYSGVAPANRSKKTIRARVEIDGGSFGVSDWRENP